MGCVFAPAFSTATLGVGREVAGVASAMVNTSQQVGGSVGISILSTVYATAAAGYAIHAHPRASAIAAMIHGDMVAFVWAAGIFGTGLIIALIVLPGRRVSGARAGEASLVDDPNPR